MALSGEVKITVVRNRLRVDGAIDGHAITALADTGATRTILSRAVAQDLHLPMDDIPGYRMYGAGGNSTPMLARVQELRIGTSAVKNIPMIAAGERRFDADMLLGQDFWGQWDVDFDLAKGVIRLLTPNRACGDGDMVYWAKAGQAYGVAPMVGDEDSRKRVVVQVRLNGKPVRALLDSGAQRSVATLRVADRVGVAAADRAPAGTAHGLGGRDVPEVFGRLDSFSVGDEAIRNTHLLFGDLFGGVGYTETGSHITSGAQDAPEMLLGADFLRAHHVLVSQARRAIYFTYEGGPVFDTRHVAADAPVRASAPPTATPAATSPPPAPPSGP